MTGRHFTAAGAYDLRLQASYDSGVPFDMEGFRAFLKAQRKERVGSRAKLAARCTPRMNPTTIQNAELGPDMPGMETVARMIEGTGQTLSSFFLQLERSQNKGLPLDTASVQDAAFPGAEGSHEGRRDQVSAEPAQFREAAAIVIGYLQDVARQQRHPARAARDHRPATKARTRQSKRR